MAAPTEDWWPGAFLSLRGPCAWFLHPQLVREGLAPRGLQGRGFPPATTGSSRGSASPSGAFSFPSPEGSQPPQHHALLTRVGSVPARLAEMRVSSARLPLLARVSVRSAPLLRQPFFSHNVYHLVSFITAHRLPPPGSLHRAVWAAHCTTTLGSGSSLGHLEAVWESCESVTPKAILNECNFHFHNRKHSDPSANSPPLPEWPPQGCCLISRCGIYRGLSISGHFANSN